MTRRVCVLLVCVVALAALVAGCGGSGQGTTKTGATSGLSIATIKQLNRRNTAKSVALCHQAASNPGLPADQKALLQTECEYIRTGNYRGLHTIDRQICQLEAAQMAEPQRSQMKAQCKAL